MSSKPKYGKFPIYTLVEVEFLKKHGQYNKGDKAFKHPNTAILLKHKGIIKGDEQEAKNKEVKEPKVVKPRVKKSK